MLQKIVSSRTTEFKIISYKIFFTTNMLNPMQILQIYQLQKIKNKNNFFSINTEKLNFI